MKTMANKQMENMMLPSGAMLLLLFVCVVVCLFFLHKGRKYSISINYGISLSRSFWDETASHAMWGILLLLHFLSATLFFFSKLQVAMEGCWTLKKSILISCDWISGRPVNTWLSQLHLTRACVCEGASVPNGFWKTLSEWHTGPTGQVWLLPPSVSLPPAWRCG